VTSTASYRVFEVVYTPVPESSSFVMALAGAAIVGFKRREQLGEETRPRQKCVTSSSSLGSILLF
jgi:hypothetical protein